MRVADKMNFDQVTTNLGRNRSDLSELQNQAATQRRVNRPSDDPIAAARVLGARTDIAGNAQYMKGINSAKSFLEYSEQSLGELADALIRAKELAISQANDASANSRTREVAGAEIGQLYKQVVQLGNRKLGERFLFGGFKTTRPPFELNGSYKGDDGEMEIGVGKEAKVTMNVPGSRAFLGKDIRAEKEKAIFDASSLRAETLEETHASDAEFVNARAHAQEAAGLPIETNGQKDGDQTIATAIQSQANALQPPAAEPENKPDPANGYVSSKALNVFTVLKNLEIALRSNDKAGVQDSIEAVDDAIAQSVLVRSELGARVGALNSGMESLQKNQVDSKTLASTLEDADTFELVSDLNKSESTLKATMQTSSKLIQTSLLDFLR